MGGTALVRSTQACLDSTSVEKMALAGCFADRGMDGEIGRKWPKPSKTEAYNASQVLFLERRAV